MTFDPTANEHPGSPPADRPSSRPGRLGVGVVGAGRVGAVLASALRSCGHVVVAVSGASADTLERIDALLPGVPVEPVDVVVERSELVFLTVPDDDLPQLVQGLAELGHFRPGQLVVHCAGRYGTEVLTPALAAGAIPLAIHPAMTFTGTSVDLSRLVGAPFAVSAPAPVLPIAQALVVELGGEPIVLDDDARGLYHAALSHGANHLVTLAGQAIRILGEAGIADGGGLLAPLMGAALDGALRGGDAALTGPVSRGDACTVAEHVDRLSRLSRLSRLTVEDAGAGGNADILPAYVAMARATAARALATGRIDARQAADVLDVLDGASVAGRPNGADADPEPVVIHRIGDLRERLERAEDEAGRRGVRRAVVMTMGSLHAGHLQLVRRARELADEVVVTIFVNPLQFGADEDLDRYPRTLAADVAALREIGGVDVVFAPTAHEMYPSGPPQVRMSTGDLGRLWEGAARPGHFDGVLTVVAKLLHLTQPHVALFGQKDAQQLALIRRMVVDLDLPVEIVAVPIVRETDGLALSSRNAYLDEADRRAALVLSRAMRAAVDAAPDGPAAVLRAAGAEVARRDGRVDLDYLELVDPVTMARYLVDPPEADPPALVMIAARVGEVRLIDNAVIDWGPPRQEQEYS